jgi:hypothetical protein
MSDHTCAWSDPCRPSDAIDRVTCDIRFARPLEYCARGADANLRDFARHRPASTQVTGIVSSECAATRIVRLTMRFCFAPISSSPSTIKTEDEPRLTNRSSGTLPCSDTSVISTSPADSA